MIEQVLVEIIQVAAATVVVRLGANKHESRWKGSTRPIKLQSVRIEFAGRAISMRSNAHSKAGNDTYMEAIFEQHDGRVATDVVLGAESTIFGAIDFDNVDVSVAQENAGQLIPHRCQLLAMPTPTACACAHTHQSTSSHTTFATKSEGDQYGS